MLLKLKKALKVKNKGRNGGIGRHAVLRGQWPFGRAGSSPAFGIKFGELIE